MCLPMRVCVCVCHLVQWYAQLGDVIACKQDLTKFANVRAGSSGGK